ncbi:MAG TPA: sugar-transfer associated ATP-grasp domain-containing protein, partial [Draconibacterium sp.]|nr:sugar-transfer associated ATP-grasp domain-containing protein [Draconibacterium sp.]
MRIKIRKLIKSKSELKVKKNLDKDYFNKSKKFLQDNFNGYSNTRWHYVFSKLNGIKSIEYIPEELYFTFIEPALNNFSLVNAFSDKNASNLFIPEKNLPKTVFKIINGDYFAANNDWVSVSKAQKIISEKTEKLVLKPAIESGGGRNIVIDNPTNILKILKEDPQYRKKSFILQEFAEQHPLLNQFHPNSLNTLRIMTARINDDIIVLSEYLRLGRNNSNVDNGMAGGLICGVNKDGTLKKTGYNKNLNTFIKHPDSGIIFEDFKLPGFFNARDFCMKTHKNFPRFTFISWDIGISKNNTPIFIEFNLKTQAINGHQIFNGPLFGEHTQYFIDKYHENRYKIDSIYNN